MNHTLDTSGSAGRVRRASLHRYQCFGADNLRTWNATSQQPGWSHHLQQSCVHNYDNVSGNVHSFVGEWSLAVTDCAKYLAGGINGGCNMTADKSCVYNPTPVAAGHPEVCDYYNKPVSQMSADYKAFLLQFARAQMDGFEQSGDGWFFWCVLRVWVPGCIDRRCILCCGGACY